MNRAGNLLSVVSVGGGTGLACLLKGLKYRVAAPSGRNGAHRPWISRLTAVVTVTDDGGSSGRLRDELRVLPPGDIRNCMVALSADESLMTQLFQYRFGGTGDLGGHSFGNLFLTALTGVTGGDFLRAIRLSSEVLAIQGRIYPSTLEDVHLEATTDSGQEVRGETRISRTSGRIRGIRLSPPDCRPVPAALQAIRAADVITIGPGSLYTSLLPNLLVTGVAEAIRGAPALKIFIGNLMTQPGETTGFRASDHLDVIHQHAGTGLFDVAILNNRAIPPRVAARYRRENAVPVETDLRRIRDLGIRIHQWDLLAPGRVVRHDPDRLADAIHHAYARRHAAGASRPVPRSRARRVGAAR